MFRPSCLSTQVCAVRQGRIMKVRGKKKNIEIWSDLENGSPDFFFPFRDFVQILMEEPELEKMVPPIQKHKH